MQTIKEMIAAPERAAASPTNDKDAAERSMPGALATELPGHLGAPLRAIYGALVKEPVPEVFHLLETQKEQEGKSWCSRRQWRTQSARRGAELARFRHLAVRRRGPRRRPGPGNAGQGLEQPRQLPEGTNLKAWLFTILRNTYFSECRKLRRGEGPTRVFGAPVRASRAARAYGLRRFQARAQPALGRPARGAGARRCRGLLLRGGGGDLRMCGRYGEEPREPRARGSANS